MTTEEFIDTIDDLVAELKTLNENLKRLNDRLDEEVEEGRK